jgi:hypothetical protein
MMNGKHNYNWKQGVYNNINGSHHLHLTSLFMLIIKVLCCIHQTWTPPVNFFKINFCNYLKISTKILEMYLYVVSLLVYVNVQ